MRQQPPEITKHRPAPDDGFGPLGTTNAADDDDDDDYYTDESYYSESYTCKWDGPEEGVSVEDEHIGEQHGGQAV